jgi:hypothetical protein
VEKAAHELAPYDIICYTIDTKRNGEGFALRLLVHLYYRNGEGLALRQ